MGRLPNPVPEETRVQGDGAQSVNPRAAVLSRGRDVLLDANGFLSYFDNSEYVPDNEKWEMLCDPQVFGAFHLRRSWILVDGVQINPTEGIAPMKQAHIVNPKYEKAVEVADYCRWMLCNTLNSFHDALHQLLAADMWCNTAGDLIWRDQEWGDYKGKLALDLIDVHLPQDYVIWRKNGRIIGLQPTIDGYDVENGVRLNKVYPIEKFALMRFRADSRHLAGTDLARVVRLPWYMKREGQPEQMKNLAQFGSPSAVATAPEDATQEVPLLTGERDGYGNYIEAVYPTGHPKAGQVIMVPPQQAMAAGLTELHSGSVMVIPPKSELKLLEPQGDGRVFSNFNTEQDWQIVIGVLSTGLAVMRQRYGSNASSKTGQEMTNTQIVSDKTALADVIKKDICVPAVHYNFPQSYWDVIPTVTCGDSRQSVYDGLFSTLLNSMPAELAIDLGNELAKRVGLPGTDWNRIRDYQAEGKLPDGTVPGTAGGSATGGGDSP